MRQVPGVEAGGQFSEEDREGGDDAVTLPSRRQIDRRVERVQHGGPRELHLIQLSSPSPHRWISGFTSL